MFTLETVYHCSMRPAVSIFHSSYVQKRSSFQLTFTLTIFQNESSFLYHQEFQFTCKTSSIVHAVYYRILPHIAAYCRSSSNMSPARPRTAALKQFYTSVYLPPSNVYSCYNASYRCDSPLGSNEIELKSEWGRSWRDFTDIRGLSVLLNSLPTSSQPTLAAFPKERLQVYMYKYKCR